MQSDAETVEEYLADLPDDRRDAIEAVRDEILANLPAGFVETMNWGMITYEVPLETFPNTYNGKPLMLAGLASQKNHMAVYLSTVYASEERGADFTERYRATGKKLDMGKSCVRFTKLDNLPVDLIGTVIADTSLDDFLEIYAGHKG
ncbi:MAG: iron chaperone [Acidimicrobiales bacterium]